ncbi:hypothetical protein K7X08_025639 [Anisodus acutangulus]|uniref:NB-ARC domain-containing protein n=1 Tax=Anisodus acutangulus TaxID=402998 RepID=A0A9Q1LTE0_9SOLA|nr:hypothetical protein K7X08_025639 [Anisodus acutangulus]
MSIGVTATFSSDLMEKLNRVADAKQEKDARLQVWIMQVQDLAHDVLDILEKHVATYNNFQEKGSWPWKKSHISLSEKLEAQNYNLSMMLEGIKARIVIIYEGHTTFLQKYGVTPSVKSSNITTRCNNHEEVLLDDDVDLVGIEYHRSVLLDWDPEWELVCVVGTKGIGKTTLVKKIFDDPTVKKHFNHTLWIEIPRFSNNNELFINILDPQDYHTRRALEAMDAYMLV